MISRFVQESQGRGGGIPHLAKNERDMGHPGFVWGIECDVQSCCYEIALKAFEGLRPVVFGPGTLSRTWGTRPISSGPVSACILVIVGYFSTYEHFASCPGHSGSA